MPVVQINLGGDSALTGNEVLTDIWSVAAGNPRLAALECLSEGDLPAVIEPERSQIPRISAIVRLASLMTHGLGRQLTLTWGWIDGTYGFGPHPVLEEFTSLPAHWLIPPVQQTPLPWQGQIFVVSELGKEPLVAINVDLNEAVAPDGSVFSGFPHELLDEEGLPIAAIGARLSDSFSGEVIQTEVHASMARYAAKLLMEERFSKVSITPLFSLAPESSSIDFWNIAEGVHEEMLSDYLD